MYASGTEGCGTASRTMSTFSIFLSAARSANLVAHFDRRLAAHLHAVDFHDAIAVAESCFLRRRPFERSGDVGVDLIAVVVVLDRSADAEVLGTLVSFQLVKLVTVVIIRMRIQRTQHADDR